MILQVPAGTGRWHQRLKTQQKGTYCVHGTFSNWMMYVCAVCHPVPGTTPHVRRLFLTSVTCYSPVGCCSKKLKGGGLHYYQKSEIHAMDDDYDSSAFCRMLKMAGLPDKTIQHTLDNGVNSLFVLKIVDFQAWLKHDDSCFAVGHCEILNLVKAWAIFNESDEQDEFDDEILLNSFTRSSFLQFVRAQAQHASTFSPVSQILFPSSTPPNHGATATSCITSSFAMASPSLSSTQAFFHVFAAVRCKQKNGGHQLMGLLADYQIISIHITRPTYKHILYQAMKKLSGTFNIEELTAHNELSIALTDRKETGVMPIDPTWAHIDDECLLISPPYILFIFHLAAIERNAFTVLVSPKKPQLVIPDKLPDTLDKPNHFSNRLYNFLLDTYVQHNLSVHRDHKDKLYHLTLSIRNVLLHFYDKLKLPSGFELPSRFDHILQRSEKKPLLKTSQVLFSTMARNLFDNRTSCLCFLSSAKWSAFDCDVKSLLTILEKKIDEMANKAEKQKNHRFQENDLSHERLTNVVTLEGTNNMENEYYPLYSIVRNTPMYSPVVVTANDIDLWKPAKDDNQSLAGNRKRRHRFREKVQLKCAISCCLFLAMGRNPSLLVLWRIPNDPADRSETEAAQTHINVMKHLPKYTLEEQFRILKRKWMHVMGSNTPPGILRMIYNEVAENGRSSKNQEMDKRLLHYALSHGDPSMYPDLRAAKNGKKPQYDIFFEVADCVIENGSGAAPYRHGQLRVLSAAQAHLTSITALYDEICRCLDASNDYSVRNAPRPSKQLLRTACCPQYPSRSISKYFTCRLPITRVLLRATMRKNNIDCHYNHKLNKLLNSLIVEVNEMIYATIEASNLTNPMTENGIIFSKGMTKISIDDKATVHIGEPGYPVRTNVRAMSKGLSHLNDANTPQAMDHDYHRTSLRPSMALIIATPLQVDDSWRKGIATAVIKDGTTQHSTAVRNVVELVQQLTHMIPLDTIAMNTHQQEDLHDKVDNAPFCYALRSDGGADRHPKNALVQLAYLYFFLKMDVDLLVVLVTASDLSYVNEVEGVMPIANVALQHQAFARSRMPDNYETMFKSCNSGKALRDKIANLPNKETQDDARKAWRSSVEEARMLVVNRFSSVNYGGRPIQIHEPASDSDLNAVWKYLQSKVDHSLDPNRTTWNDLYRNNSKTVEFLQHHTRSGRYHIEYFKCNMKECSCGKIQMPMNVWKTLAGRPRFLPFPMPAAEDGDEYLSYDLVKDVETNGSHCPSAKIKNVQGSPLKRSAVKTVSGNHDGTRKNLFTQKNVRHIINCVECGKIRLVLLSLLLELIGLN